MNNDRELQDLKNAQNELEARQRAQVAGPELLAALGAILDAVDYTSGSCGFTEMVGAVLPKVLIVNARMAMEHAK
jgi:hypothetical protein